MTVLSACGGDVTNESYDSPTRTAALMVQGGSAAPVADCEAEGCSRPRIVDGLAEQYRSDAIARAAQASEPVQDGTAPAVADAAPVAPSEPAPAAPEQAR